MQSVGSGSRPIATKPSRPGTLSAGWWLDGMNASPVVHRDADTRRVSNAKNGCLSIPRYVSGPGMVNGAAVDELLARTSSGGSSAWYLTDKLDSVRDVVSSAGSAIDHVVYDNFGNILTETSASNGDRFKFGGMEYDATDSECFDRARYYSPASGKFVEQDPIGFGAGDQNLYRFVHNSPGNYADPSGMDQSASRIQANGEMQLMLMAANMQRKTEQLQDLRLKSAAVQDLIDDTTDEMNDLDLGIRLCMALSMVHLQEGYMIHAIESEIQGLRFEIEMLAIQNANALAILEKLSAARSQALIDREKLRRALAESTQQYLRMRNLPPNYKKYIDQSLQLR